ncbi:MAG: hypothetical protein EA001_14065 [Oscillatoriales cyanobacterium]|nr:MAG: hypothetical protein EA001_14065 [Oscillatoriales cyanobacterium]
MLLQHGLGSLLAIYLVGFSIAYWKAFNRQLAILKSQQSSPQDWPAALGLVLRSIVPQLLWFLPGRSPD